MSNRPKVECCPFCGGMSVELRSGVEFGSVVGCNAVDCGAGMWAETAQEAVEHWNRRVAAYTSYTVDLDLGEMLGMWELKAEIPEEWLEEDEKELT